MSEQTRQCATCKGTNFDTALYCVHCGESLDITISRRIDVQERLEEYSQKRVIDAAEKTIVPVATAVATPTNAPAPQLHSSRPCIKLTDVGSGVQYVIMTMENDFQEITLGRPDREIDFVPIVDLSLVEGHKKGVSRFHAIIECYGNGFGLKDNSSSNGTFINGDRLLIGETRKIRDDDLINLGGVKLQFNYA